LQYPRCAPTASSADQSRDAIAHAALDAVERQTGTAQDVGGLARPRRNGAEPWQHQHVVVLHRCRNAGRIQQGRTTVEPPCIRAVERIDRLCGSHHDVAAQAFVQPIAAERGQAFAAVEQDHRGAPVEKRAARITDCPETPTGSGRRKSWPTKKMTPPGGGVGWPVVQDGCYLAALSALRRSNICAGGT
jgi:hypothetical protein